MKTYFLSASVPLASRHHRYYQTADLVAIRESLRGLVSAVLPKGRVVFGGHPAITPMLRLLGQSMGLRVRDRIVLYQSEFFARDFPDANDDFERIVVTPAGQGREDSLATMRSRMMRDFEYEAAVFIGGMEGVEVEYDLFRCVHPNSPTFPIASTGAAARILYERGDASDPRLKTETAYLTLFRQTLSL